MRVFKCRECSCEVKTEEKPHPTNNPFPTICPKCGTVNLMEITPMVIDE